MNVSSIVMSRSFAAPSLFLLFLATSTLGGPQTCSSDAPETCAASVDVSELLQNKVMVAHIEADEAEAERPPPLTVLGEDAVSTITFTAGTVPAKFCTPSNPCTACQGDCDSDADCASGFKCFQRDALQSIPGCQPGGAGDVNGYDYCYRDTYAATATTTTITTMTTTTAMPSTTPTPTTTTTTTTKHMLIGLQNLGGSGCTPSNPCTECQGDCDSDRDCASGFKCFQRNALQSIPGCQPGGAGDVKGYDYCYKDTSFKPMKWIPNLSSPFPIQPCAQIKNANGDLLPAQVRQILETEKKTKCIQVFGNLIAGTAGADSNAMRYSANIVAQLLDPNCDGTVDDPNVAAELDKFNKFNAGWLNFGTDAKSEESKMHGSFSSQQWKAGGNTWYKPGLALEEAFHMVHQMAWAEAYPDAFGYKDWGHSKQSVACLCMREAQCVWYQHPENGGCIDITGKKCYNTRPGVQDVFKSNTIPGTCAGSTHDCAYPSCDCMEFFHKVETTWLGNVFKGYERMGAKLRELQGQGLTQRAAVEKLLSQSTQCSRLLQHMKDPKMALPQMHIKETYQCGR